MFKNARWCADWYYHEIKRRIKGVKYSNRKNRLEGFGYTNNQFYNDLENYLKAELPSASYRDIFNIISEAFEPYQNPLDGTYRHEKREILFTARRLANDYKQTESILRGNA